MQSITSSVVICCYNSEYRLPLVLDSLVHAVRPDTEVIVVDNNSTDATVKIAQEENRFPISVVASKEQGIAHARMAGVLSANGEIIVFIDDDNLPASEYIENIEYIFSEHPLVFAVGGKSVAVFDDGFKVPDWFDEYSQGFAVGEQASMDGYIQKYGNLLFGAGLAVRTEILVQIYKSGFEPARTGSAHP